MTKEKLFSRREYMRQWRQKNYDRQIGYERKFKYGMTLDQFQELYAKQNGKCAICLTPSGPSAIHVDHDHITGRVRGLLCRACNIGLGHFRDSLVLLNAAIGYLK